MAELRPYQQSGLDGIRSAFRQGARSVLYVLPTGGGKTHVAAAMIRAAREKRSSVLFLAPRRELVFQASAKLSSVGVYHGVIMAGEQASAMADVQVGTIPTLHARAIQRKKIQLPRAKLVVVDEAHIGIGGRAQAIVDHYRDAGAVVVGLTATPARTDGRGLGAVYDSMVLGPSVSELMAAGNLVPARYFSGEAPDLSGVKLQAGDYHQGELGARADQPKLVGDVVSNWRRLASDRQTFVFAVNVAHSRHLAEEFRSAGIRAEHIDGTTEPDERRAIQERLRSGETQVLTNCEVMTYGVDFPPVSCIVLACPTKSVTKYLQMVGRGLRTSPGKTDCYVLDHAGAVLDPALGFVDDPRPWSLDGKSKIQDRQAAAKKEPKEITCGDCGTVFRAAKFCPKCGSEMGATYTKAVEAWKAELQEIDRQNRDREKRAMTIEQKAALYGELKAYAADKGYAQGWAAHKYREKTGVWPNDARIKEAPLTKPSPETLKWIQHLNIRRAKSRDKARREAA